MSELVQSKTDPELGRKCVLVYRAVPIRRSATALDIPKGSGDQSCMTRGISHPEEVQLLNFKSLCGNGSAPTGRGPKVKVNICVIFLKVGEIDTLKEHYEADVMIKSKWREPSLDKGRAEIPLPIDWGKYWNPNLFVENTIGEPKESAFQMLTFTKNGEAIVVEKRRIKGTFMENLELNDFPFDVQDLTVTVMSERSAVEIELVEDPDELHRVNRQSFIDEQEWRLYKFIETEITEVANEYADPTVRRGALQVRCRAARRPAYFFWNIFLITFLICSLVFATFAVERKLPQNRLQLSFTLVLTSVAFKFVVNQSLPKISYLTYLDKYVLVAMIMLTTVCAWHGLTTITGDYDSREAQYVDTGALILFASVYVLFNLGFVFMIYLKPYRKRRTMKRKEREYSERVQQMMLTRTPSQKFSLDTFPHVAAPI